MNNIQEWLTKTKASLTTWSGWLDVAAAALGGLLALDPTAALIVRDVLPEAVQPFYTIAVVLVFFILMARAGFQVLAVLEGDTLISITWVPVQLTQSVIPIGALLFILCQLLSLPGYWNTTAAGISLEHAEIEEEVEAELEKNNDRV